VFLSLKQWIEGQQGGFVHGSIRMEPQTRELFSIDFIPNGEIIFQIPNIIFSPMNKSTFPEAALWPGEIPQEELYHPCTDVLLAWYLALKPASIQPFINSLPEGMDQALPRCWSENDLNRLLRGSSVYERAKEMKRGIQSDYNILIHYISMQQQQQQQQQQVELHKNETKTKTDNIRLPSFEDFSNAMAAVTSRAFCCCPTKGRNETCMVPLLDLCNHHRGSNIQKKNVSYRFEERIDNNSADLSLAVVVAHSDIAVGETLRITYGAQSNSQLLLNYGFCIAENMEPDGSCNDVLEFERNILLRIGPRDYTYGPFVKALEFCQKILSGMEYCNEDDTDLQNSSDDLEQFLNEADELESTSEVIDYGVNHMACHDDDVGDSDDKEHQRRQEQLALSYLRNRLFTMTGTYMLKRHDLDWIMESPQDSQDYFAAVLIKSELRTIQFFCMAIDCIMEQLWNSETQVYPVDLVDLSPLDSTLMKRQVEELLMAYTRIRHNCIP
jgi:hypothetical protein